MGQADCAQEDRAGTKKDSQIGNQRVGDESERRRRRTVSMLTGEGRGHINLRSRRRRPRAGRRPAPSDSGLMLQMIGRAQRISRKIAVFESSPASRAEARFISAGRSAAGRTDTRRLLLLLV